MKTGRGLAAILCAVIGLVYASPSQSADSGDKKTRIAVTLKTGRMAMLDDEQTVDNQLLTFDRSSTSLFSAEIEGRILRDAGLVVSGEYLHFNMPYKVGSGATERRFRAETDGHFIKAKYIFEVSPSWQPYAGIGWGTVSIANQGEAPIDHDTSGDIMQGVIGMQWRNDHFGIRLEYLRLDGKVEDDTGDEVKMGSHGILLGVTYHFLRR